MNCQIENCETLHYARGWCQYHYRVWYRKQNPQHKIKVRQWQKLHKEAHNKHGARWRNLNPEKKQAANHRGILSKRARRYGISVESLELMLSEQHFRCIICLNSIEFNGLNSANVDHDHKTGRVRGILCGNCNRGLGLFKDNPQFLKKAAEYIGEN